MSLINDMLKDLEDRGGNGRTTGVRATPVKRASGVTRTLFIVLALTVVALAGALAWSLRPATSAAVPASAVVVAREAPPAPARIDAPVVGEDVAPAASEVSAPPVSAPVNDVAAQVTAPTEIASTPAPEVTTTNPEPQQEAPANTAADTMIVRRHEPTDAEKAARAGRDGFAALRLGDWATAARLLGELVALEPANDEAREGLAVALANQGRVAESDGVLLDGIAVGASPARFAKLRARLQAARGELDAALDSLSVAVPTAASDPEFHALKAALAQQAGRYDMAATLYETLTTLDAANGTWQAGLGMALDARGDFAGALAAYERAYAADGLEPALRAHIESRLAALKTD